MTDPMPILFTIGHGRTLKPADILRLVKEHDPVACPIVVDVRDSRVSQRNRAFDFSEVPVLGEGNGQSVGEVIPGCRYVWFPKLGNPTRKLPWVPDEKAEVALEILARVIRREGDTLYQGPLVLLCSEAKPAKCHRREIAEELARRVPGLRIAHLGSESRPIGRRQARDEWEAPEV